MYLKFLKDDQMMFGKTETYRH